MSIGYPIHSYSFEAWHLPAFSDIFSFGNGTESAVERKGIMIVLEQVCIPFRGYGAMFQNDQKQCQFQSFQRSYTFHAHERMVFHDRA
jgi:hypothetical protein